MRLTLPIPDSTKDMDISHLPFAVALTNLCEDISKIDDSFIDELDPVTISDLNALFFSEPTETFDIYTPTVNRNVFSEIIASFARHEKNDIKLEWKINDVVYVFNPDFSKMPVAFWRDIKRADFAENPFDLVAFCYIEKGLTYNEIDKNKNIINPKHERGEAFRGHMNLAQYLDLQGFFLESYAVLSPYSKAKEVLKRARLGIGKSQ